MSKQHYPTRAQKRRFRQRITYPVPPAWMEDIPTKLLDVRDDGFAGPATLRRLYSWLANRGLPRPTLLDLEAERRRRGIR